MGFIWTIVIGLLAGVVAKFIMTGDRDEPTGFVMTTIAELVAKTGLSRDELLLHLSKTLPDAVEQVTPEGYFPPISAPEPRGV